MNPSYGIARLKKLKAYVIARDTYYKGKKINAELKARCCYSRELATYDLDKIISEATAYAESLRISQCEYLFSKSARKPALFNAVYAILINDIAKISVPDNSKWEIYFDSFQKDDGIWRDSSSLFRCWDSRSAEWNDIHIIPHIIYAYEAIGALPKKRFSFLDKFTAMDYTKKFCNAINFEDFWGESNGIMNYLVSMLYARDSMKDHSFDATISYICNYLIESDFYQKGLWTKDNDITALYGALRGGYHIWALLMREGIPLKNDLNVIDTIMALQNKYGGFNDSPIASTCMNIDCIDPLVRFATRNPEYRKKEIRKTLEKARTYLLHNQNRDGGFCFERFQSLRYGNDESISAINESNLFATWFTLVALCIIDEYLGGRKRLTSVLPGMEYHI